MIPTAIFIGGPTSSCKTRLAKIIQSEIPSYIINADSMQVYNKLDILTNKPNKTEIVKSNCNLFGFVEYPKLCSVGLWKNQVDQLFMRSKKIPIVVGGTGLYLDSLINELSPIPKIPESVKIELNEIHSKFGNDYLYKKLKKIDPKYAKKISSNDTQRILRATAVSYSTGKPISQWHMSKKNKKIQKLLYVILKNERNILYENINERCKKMIRSGVLEEVRGFIKIKSKINHPLHKSIGFRPLEKYIKGFISLEESMKIFMQESRRYAKRQLTWFNNKAKGAKHLDFTDAKDYILNNI